MRTVDVKDLLLCETVFIGIIFIGTIFIGHLYKGTLCAKPCDRAEQSPCRCNCNLSWTLVNTDVIFIISITVDIVPINYLD